MFILVSSQVAKSGRTWLLPGSLWEESRLWNQNEFKFGPIFLISYVLLGKFLNFTESQCFYKLGLIVLSS